MDLTNKNKSFFELNEQDSNVGHELPDYVKADSLAHSELNSKYEIVKNNSINSIIKKEVQMTNLLKPIGYLIALVAAFVFALFFPHTTFEGSAIGIVTTLTGLLGLTDWRTQFDNFEGYFKSKTLVGALLALIPALGFCVISLFGVVLPSWVQTLLTWILTAGGGTSLVGIFAANAKATPVSTTPPTGLSK